ncbi:MAG TPA: Ldh family oxidoreductase [Acetobacteraceae bacterium]|nr:Ldh family oxidoreductase [Acetobacteraceae bacterium]
MKYAFGHLVNHAAALLSAAGLDGDKPTVTANLLVAADAMGHDTHGLAQLPDYLDEIASGAMRPTGEPEIVVDRPSACVWDGHYLPGVWLVDRAVRLAAERAAVSGACSISIRRSHHIACLATFLTAATHQGMMAIVTCSDPSEARVVPFGGTRPVFMPDPIAIGIPTESDPILIDISTSITTLGMVARGRREGTKLPAAWVLDADGQPTDDPNMLQSGSLLPVGGLDHGHKGTGLAWMVEAMSQGLAGHGRADEPRTWGCSVFVQVFDPAMFAGGSAFTRQTEWIARACRATPSRDPDQPLRLPGARALAGLRHAKANGLSPRTGVLEALAPWAERFGLPQPVGTD